ncbi:MAG: hypothetical protein QW051_02225 [Candidatus Aenigmatarchaeota archaeon]
MKNFYYSSIFILVLIAFACDCLSPIFIRENDLVKLEVRFYCKVFSKINNEPLKNATVWVSLDTSSDNNVLSYDVTNDYGIFDMTMSVPIEVIKKYGDYLHLNISKGGYEFLKYKVKDLINLKNLSSKTIYLDDFGVNPTIDTIRPFVVKFTKSDYSLFFTVLFSEEVVFSENFDGVSVALRREDPCDTSNKTYIFKIFPNNPDKFKFIYHENYLNISHPLHDSVSCRIVRFIYSFYIPHNPIWQFHSISIDDNVTDLFGNKLKNFFKSE